MAETSEVFGFTEEIAKYISIESVISLLVKIGLCILVIIIAAVLIKVFKKAVKKLIYSHNRFSERKARTLNTVCASVIKYVMYFFVVCEILSLFGINIMSFIAVAGVGSIAIAFGAQSLMQDIITGMFILIEDQFAVGDRITVEGYSGIVEGIGIRTTRIRSADGDLFIIPNGQVTIVTNMSKGFNRAVVDISVAYEENIDRVMDIMRDELKTAFETNKINGLLGEPQVLGIVDLGDFSVVIRVTADSVIGENWAIERDIRKFIKNRFDRENICIPYPQVVLHKSDNGSVQ